MRDAETGEPITTWTWLVCGQSKAAIVTQAHTQQEIAEWCDGRPTVQVVTRKPGWHWNGTPCSMEEAGFKPKPPAEPGATTADLLLHSAIRSSFDVVMTLAIRQVTAKPAITPSALINAVEAEKDRLVAAVKNYVVLTAES